MTTLYDLVARHGFSEVKIKIEDPNGFVVRVDTMKNNKPDYARISLVDVAVRNAKVTDEQMLVERLMR